MAEVANWFTYFPEDYRWSAAVVGTLSSAPWGGADIGEVDAVGRRLRNHLGNDEAWFHEWVAMADKVRTLAFDEEHKSHALSAAYHHQRACMYYQMAERFRTPKDEPALDAYSKGLESFTRFTHLIDRPRIEHVEVPFEPGGSLPGLFVHADNTTASRSPVVVFFDGLDVTKEIQYMRGVHDLVRRGLHCLVMDGPGTGEAIRFRHHYLRHDYEVAGSAAFNYVTTRDDVDDDRIGVMAISLGGYYAPRIASMDPRFKACVAWGAIWDYHATWKRRIDAAMHADMSVPGHHIQWILNAKSLDEALQKLEPFRLDGVVQQMRCPFLLTHGEEDRQVPVQDAKALFDAVGSADKTFKLFTVAEGGSQHCQRDNLSLGTTYIYDWLQDKLVR